MNKLLPCPFCGGDAVKTWSHAYGDCAHCGNDECAASAFYDRVMVSEWNTRHTPEGWQLVPVEPRKEQLDAFSAADKWLHSNDGAGYLAASSFDGAKGEPYYKAMLAAAPKWGGE